MRGAQSAFAGPRPFSSFQAAFPTFLATAMSRSVVFDPSQGMRLSVETIHLRHSPPTPLPNCERGAIAGRCTQARQMSQSHTSEPIRFQTRTVPSASPNISSSLSPTQIHQPQRPVRCHPTHADITDNVIVASTSTVITGRATNTTYANSFMPAVSRNHLPSSLKSEQSRLSEWCWKGRPKSCVTSARPHSTMIERWLRRIRFEGWI
ncbi:hypothetical protein BLNAU_11984 [Blattamonas nauphoetae]|uniref:Uncharacterized protein n=1 Tax=Blattamonas nauphoetae TaxID=2049346 RepID=A0ABQ9XP67_9EUKA|nr:hypothetical protein BLNAU_11984 [Blattamonas nauphoetae]